MKNFLLCTLVLCFFSNTLFAQREVLKQYNLTEQQVKAHQISLPKGATVRSNESAEPSAADIQVTQALIFKKFGQPSAAAKPTFDVNYFGPVAHFFLKDKVKGYAFQVYKGGNAIYTGQWNWAKSPADGNELWTSDSRMHIASASKLMTAMGLVKLLDKKKISLDASIQPYLPAYWQKAAVVQSITFRMLLQHTSGFSSEDSKCDFLFMKEQIAAGRPTGAFEYANANYSIMRILISVIDGHTPPNMTLSGLTDLIWDLVTTNYFMSYMNQNVFSLAGLPPIGCAPIAGSPTAKAYASKNDIMGEAGNWSTLVGGVGFYMSIGQSLKTLNAFRNGIIMPVDRAQYMLDNNLGINGAIGTSLGNIYVRKGGWSYDGKVTQTILYCLPNNINIAVWVNSPIDGFLDDKGNNKHIHSAMLPIIKASIH